MQRLTRLFRITTALALFVILGCSSSEEDPGATETNVAPAPCDSNDDCPSHQCLGIGGEQAAGGALLGFCEQISGGAGAGAGGAAGNDHSG